MNNECTCENCNCKSDSINKKFVANDLFNVVALSFAVGLLLILTIMQFIKVVN